MDKEITNTPKKPKLRRVSCKPSNESKNKSLDRRKTTRYMDKIINDLTLNPALISSEKEQEKETICKDENHQVEFKTSSKSLGKTCPFNCYVGEHKAEVGVQSEPPDLDENGSIKYFST